jgi:glycosyltransferase involved in cell wall biosynthesis
VGTPVLAAPAPGVSEVCGEAARYARAGDPDAFVTAMVELASDPGLRSELSRLGRERAARFSWRDCALQHAYAYSLALRP